MCHFFNIFSIKFHIIQKPMVFSSVTLAIDSGRNSLNRLILKSNLISWVEFPSTLPPTQFISWNFVLAICLFMLLPQLYKLFLSPFVSWVAKRSPLCPSHKRNARDKFNLRCWSFLFPLTIMWWWHFFFLSSSL